MIKLSDRQPFAGGTKRDCYVHPEDETKVIKIIPPSKSPEMLFAQKFWIRRMFQTPKTFDANRAESEKFEKLEKKLGDLQKVLPHLVKYFGKTKTDLGEGLVFQAIKNYDGVLSETVLDASETGGYKKATLLTALEEFKTNRHDAVIFNDVGKNNVAVQVLNADHSSYKFWVIDGINCGPLIPISEYSKIYASARKAKKIWQLKKYIVENF